MEHVPLKSKPVSLVWMNDLDEYIERHLGRPWKTQQDLVVGQDTIYEFEVDPDPGATALVQAWLATPFPEFNLWSRDEEMDTGTLLNELCNRGLLPQGRLTVHIWW